MTLALVYDLMTLLTAGLVAALVCRRFNVSILIGYLVVGAIIGHGVLGWVQDDEHQLAHFAEAGVFLLLFSIGLEFSIDDLKRLGKNFIVGGAFQMLLVAIPVAFVLRLWVHQDWRPPILIASAVAFSSTVLVFRALSEFGQAQQSHGRRAIGILLFQDAALVPLLLMVPLLTGGEAASPWIVVRLVVVSSAFVLAVLFLRHALAEWIIPVFSNFRRSELVVLFTLVSLGGVTLAAYSLGLPPAVGAFAAGLIFNGNRWSHQIDALVLPFRETFAAVFFVGLGLIFDPRLVLREPELLLLGLPAVIVLKGAAAAVALWLTGLPLRASIGTGIGLAHVGEFSFVLVLLGVDRGVLGETDYQRVVAIAVGSLILTPSLMKFGLRWVKSDSEEEATGHSGILWNSEKRQAAVIGVGPIGRSVSSQLEMDGYDVCLVDLSPINLHSFAQQGFRTVAGDATSLAVLQQASVGESSLVVVGVPDDATATQIVKAIRRLNTECTTIVRCRYQSNLAKLKKAGASSAIAEENEAAMAIMRRLQEWEG